MTAACGTSRACSVDSGFNSNVAKSARGKMPSLLGNSAAIWIVPVCRRDLPDSPERPCPSLGKVVPFRLNELD